MTDDQVQIVEVRLDGGAWGNAATTSDWSLWTYPFDLTTLVPGDHSIEARATSVHRISAAATVFTVPEPEPEPDPEPEPENETNVTDAGTNTTPDGPDPGGDDTQDPIPPPGADQVEPSFGRSFLWFLGGVVGLALFIALVPLLRRDRVPKKLHVIHDIDEFEDEVFEPLEDE